MPKRRIISVKKAQERYERNRTFIEYFRNGYYFSDYQWREKTELIQKNRQNKKNGRGWSRRWDGDADGTLKNKMRRKYVSN
jgi:hypothetical protein